MKKSYTGSATGLGSVFDWNSSNKASGVGRMTILESRTPEQIDIKLEFTKPFPSTNAIEFTFKPDADKTIISWTMKGNNTFIAKAFSLFMNYHKMIGGMFEQGLANIKAIVENKGSRLRLLQGLSLFPP